MISNEAINYQPCASSSEDRVYYFFRNFIAITIFQQIAAFLELATERATGTHTTSSIQSTYSSVKLALVLKVHRQARQQSFVIEITDKHIVVKEILLQVVQIMRRSVNSYRVLSIQIHTKELQQLTTGSSFTSLARDLTVGLDLSRQVLCSETSTESIPL